jgi:hypothetical protein
MYKKSKFLDNLLELIRKIIIVNEELKEIGNVFYHKNDCRLLFSHFEVKQTFLSRFYYSFKELCSALSYFFENG